ncbi:MAG: hypothetical protein GQ570_15140 [Helicobacteraceae bacterium]|nr:hypothetical protein [Helicobacteraceae bacterium]
MKNDRNVVYREDVKTVDQQTGEITTTSSRRLSKASRTPDFVMLFSKHVAFLEHLTKGETVVLAEILAKYVGVENLLNMSPAIRATITKKLDVDKSYVNKAIKGLSAKEVIIKDDNGLSYLNPHLFGKGNWDEVEKLRHEIAYDFDFQTMEKVETRKVITITDKEFDMNEHKVIEATQTVENGVNVQEILVEENEKQAVMTFEEPKITPPSPQHSELDILNAQNKSKELAIQEMKLKLEMKKEGLL